MQVQPNFAARLARDLTRSAHAPLRSWRMVLLVLLIVVTSVCAGLAVAERYQIAGQSPSLLEATDFIYAPFLYLVPETSLANASALTLPEIIARITGPLIPVLSLFWLVRQRLLLWMAAALASRHMAGHAVVLGQNGSADALALASGAQGSVVALIDPSLADDADREQTLAAAGIIGMATPACSMNDAASVAVWYESDADNIAAAAALRADHSLATEEIDVAVQSNDLHHALIQVPDLMLDRRRRLRPHSLVGMAVRAALAGPQLPQLALERKQTRVSLCLWGMSDALVWAAELALQQYWSAQLGAPRVIWVDAGEGVALPEAMARFSQHAGPVFGEGAACPEVVMMPSSQACLDPQVTCHLIDAGEADATLAKSFALAARLCQEHAHPAPTKAVLGTDRAIEPVFATERLAFLPPILPGADVTINALRNRVADQRAAEIHLAYDREFGDGGTAPASGRWQDLPETYVAANRAAADHLAIKQWDAASSGLKGEALIEALACAEHNRWSAERLLADWAPSGEAPRDNERRLHPDLRPWDALSDEAREKDRGAVRAVV